MEKVLGEPIVVNQRGGITIPKEARELLKLNPGDHLSLIYKDGKLLIRKVETVYKDFEIED